MTKGGQLRLRHDAMDQDCKWVFHCWPCALPDQKNGATAPGLATNWHMTPWRKPPCPSLPSEARLRVEPSTAIRILCRSVSHRNALLRIELTRL